MQFNHFKKCVFVLSTAATLSFLTIPNANAQAAGTSTGGASTGGAASGGASEGYLKKIADNTLGMLNSLDALLASPDFGLGMFVKSWISTDNPADDTAATLQTNFAKYGKLLTEQATNQETQQVLINSDLLNNGVDSAFSMSFNVAKAHTITPNALQTLPYANDLVYSTLLGQPFSKSDKRSQGKNNPLDPAYNYIKNASGVNIYHPIPGQNWQGSSEAQSRYQNYYNTVMAAESFNAYVMSNQYVDHGQLNALQNQLITQATDSETWFAKVGSENLGYVLRQILMYESQVFVMLTELVKTQKQAVMAQTMTNSLLIAINQLSESMLISNAKGVQPTT